MDNNTVSQAFVAKEIITIDPGKSNGGIVKWSDRYESYPLKKFTFEDMVDFFKYQSEICELPLIFIERISTFTGDYGSKEARGRAYRLDKLKGHYTELISAIKTSKLRYIEVMPYHWQSKMKIHKKGEDSSIRKKRYIDIAKGWFPGQKVVGWNADAFLLQEYAKHMLKYEPSWIMKRLKEHENKKIQSKLKFK